MESNVTPIEAKEQLKSKKFGQLMRIEITNENKKTSDDKNSNIFFELSLDDINHVIWLLDETPKVVFAISGKISHEFDDFATILLGFEDNKSVVVSLNWVTTNPKQNCNIICSTGEISLNLLSQELTDNDQKDNALKVAEAAFLSSQKGIPIYLELK